MDLSSFEFPLRGNVLNHLNGKSLEKYAEVMGGMKEREEGEEEETKRGEGGRGRERRGEVRGGEVREGGRRGGREVGEKET